jgi:uncharacterized protein
MADDAFVKDDPTLVRFRAALAEVYGDRIERVVLYGSRARGDARPDSDYDVAVFLHDMNDRGRELYRLADIATEVLYSGGGVINAMAYDVGAYRDRTLLMFEIRRDGIDLSAAPFARLVPNEKTIAAMREASAGNLPRFKNTKDLLRELNKGD